jgi:4-hydroxy-2-oxoheptanedioate aldolase
MSGSVAIPENVFKRGLAEGRQQIGLWCTLPSAYATEMVAGAGFDWLLLDTEHSPGDVLTVLAQLQALASYSVSPVVRPAVNDLVLIKRFLDIGVQSLLIPNVQNAAEAREAVAAVRYPPGGKRGVAGLTRATRFGRVAGYMAQADSQMCVLVQVESKAALDEIEAIAAVDGVDGMFIGPADLAASLGYPGQSGHPAVIEAIEGALARIAASGVPSGILASDAAYARRCMALGTRFTAVGLDVEILARGAEALAAGSKSVLF